MPYLVWFYYRHGFFCKILSKDELNPTYHFFRKPDKPLTVESYLEDPRKERMDEAVKVTLNLQSFRLKGTDRHVHAYCLDEDLDVLRHQLARQYSNGLFLTLRGMLDQVDCKTDTPSG